jgi:CPA1 family monovalent cation:H+ antiporter
LEIFEATLALLAAALVLSALAARLSVPYPSLLVLGGLVLGLTPVLPEVELDPAIAFALFLPPILFEAAYSTSWRDFRIYLAPILGLAVILVCISTWVVAVVADRLIPELPLGAAFVLGAIVSPPDAAAATAVLRQMRLPRSVVTVLEGESLLNDAVALVIYNFAVQAVVTGHFSKSAAGEALIVSTAGSVTLGLAVGWLWSKIAERIADPVISILASFLVAFGTYGLAEALDVSGVLAVVSAGLVFSIMAIQTLTPDTRLTGAAVWRLVVFALNAVAFVLIGLQLPRIVGELGNYSVVTLAIDGGVIAATVILVRIVWIMTISQIQRWVFGRGGGHYVGGWREALVISWSGMRGLISLAAALALPETIADGQAFPARALVQFLSFAVILATLVVQGLSLGALIRVLGVKKDSTADDEERAARIEAANAAIAAIERIGENPAIPRPVIEQTRMLYINRLDQLSEPDRKDGASAAANDPDHANFSDSLRLAAIAAERKALHEMRRRRAIGDGPLRVMQSELDLMETVLNRRGATYSRIGVPHAKPKRS